MTEPTAPPAADDTPSADYIRTRILAAPGLARLVDWGRADYGSILQLQERLRVARREDAIPDTWLAGEHLPVITQGVRGRPDDLVAAADIPVFTVDRGGMTTLHNPGQLVIYPIVRVQPGLMAQARLSRTLLTTVRDWLAETTGVNLTIHRGRPGLFLGERKIAAIGISIHGYVSMHGIAINLCNDLSPWRAIVPCGEPSTLPMTLSEAAGRTWTPHDLLATMPAWLPRAWGYDTVEPVALDDLHDAIGKGQSTES